MIPKKNGNQHWYYQTSFSFINTNGGSKSSFCVVDTQKKFAIILCEIKIIMLLDKINDLEKGWFPFAGFTNEGVKIKNRRFWQPGFLTSVQFVKHD